MKRFLIHTSFAALLFLLSLVLGGCTRNNGDIGQWFGRWQIEAIDSDGSPEPGYNGLIFIEFQNNIVRLVKLAPDGYEQTTYTCFGTWEQPSDNLLVFDFTHSDDNGNDRYLPFSELHFPHDAPFPLSISDNSGKKCTLTYVDGASSATYSYHLVKR